MLNMNSKQDVINYTLLSLANIVAVCHLSVQRAFALNIHVADGLSSL